RDGEKREGKKDEKSFPRGGSSEPVLLGSAILGAVAGRVAASLPEAMKQFTQVDATYHSETAFSPLHQRRYAAYKALQQAGRLIRE
nr:hypothetical protein [Klebsiella pneumoniae]